MSDKPLYSCINCGEELHEVFEGSASRHQFDDALDITVRFGYDEFVDHEPDEPDFERASWCRGCATQLTTQFPGFRRMLRLKPFKRHYGDSFGVNYENVRANINISRDIPDDPNCNEETTAPKDN